MENASKALIIAGAILLAILLISLGIYIFNQAQSVTNGAGMSKSDIAAFNSTFLKYEGERKGSEVRNLIQEVNVNNNNKEDNATITIEHEKVTIATLTTDTYRSSAISNTQTYKVEITGYDTNGRINKIKISKP